MVRNIESVGDIGSSIDQTSFHTRCLAILAPKLSSGDVLALACCVVTTVLLITGSIRSASTNAALLRTAHSLAPGSVYYDRLASLPHFNPDDDRDPLPGSVIELRAEIAAASALLFCTPEYAGALPGSFKNLLDLTIGGGEIYQKPVAWINVSTSGTGAAGAHDELRRVLGYAGTARVEAACRDVPVPRSAVGPDGLVDDPEVQAAVREVIEALTAAVPTGT
jgi:chromate reductase